MKQSTDGDVRAGVKRLWRCVKYEYIHLSVDEDGLSLFIGLQGYFIAPITPSHFNILYFVPIYFRNLHQWPAEV
ncbi:MAG: hypothetical protein ABI151_17690, partial [Chitinophagaceae bacterium]